MGRETARWMVAAAMLLSVTAVGAPSAGALQFNDRPANATPIPALPYREFAPTFDASVDASEQLAAAACTAAGFDFNQSLWFRYAPPANSTEQLVAERLGPAGPGGLVVIVEDGTPAVEACVERKTAFTASGTSTYLIGMFGDAAALSLRVPGPPPANDEPDAAAPIEFVPVTLSAEVIDATVSEGESSARAACDGLPLPFERSVWYSLEGGLVGSPVLSVNPVFGDGVVVAEDDGTVLGCSDTEQFIAIDPTVSYRIGLFGNATTPAVVDLRGVRPPDNDRPADARAIDGIPFVASQDLADAVVDPTEAAAAAACAERTVFERTVWYSFSSPTTSQLFAEARPNSYLAGVVVLSVADDGGVEALGCDYRRVAFDVDTGGRYLIGLFGRPQNGSDELKLVVDHVVAPPPNDRIEDAIAIGAIPFSAEVDTTGATALGDELLIEACIGRPVDRAVWYRLDVGSRELKESVKLDVSASEVPAAYAVFGPSRNGPLPMTCTGSPSRIAFEPGPPVGQHLAAGTYFIAVFPVDAPGVVRLAMTRTGPPPKLTATVAPKIRVTATGSMIVSGTISCGGGAELNDDSTASVVLEVSQLTPTGLVRARGKVDVPLRCGGAVRRWQGEWVPDEGRFHVGRAYVDAFAVGCDDLNCATSRRDAGPRTVTR